jgi:hypothetical protein
MATETVIETATSVRLNAGPRVPVFALVGVAEDAGLTREGLHPTRFPSLPSAVRSIFRPYGQAAIRGVATDHETLLNGGE